MSATAHIALVGDHDASITAHRAIPKALSLANARTGSAVAWTWVDTRDIASASDLGGYSAIWAVPASPYENDAGALDAIRHARQTGKPFLGTCGGYQYAVLEYARSVLGHVDAASAEVDPACAMPLIGALVCALRDVTGSIALTPGSRMAQIYGQTLIDEGYYCGYGINPAYLNLFDTSDLRFSGFDVAGEPRAFELEGHPFFMGTAFQPERAALSDRSHPLVEQFVTSAVQRIAQAA